MRPGPTFRAFEPDDARALVAVHRRAIMQTPDRSYTRKERTSWAAGLTPESYLASAGSGEVFEVADWGDQVVAFCGRKDGAVQGLYVDPAHQRRGIGRMLLARAETALRGEGAERMVVRAALSAVRFYEKAGYTVVSEETHESRGGLPLAIKVMAKRLGPGAS